VSRRYELNDLDHLPAPEHPRAPATERQSNSDSEDSRARGGGSESPEPHRDHPIASPNRHRSNEPRTPYRDRDRTYSLRSSEIQTLKEIGTFRAVDSEAIAEIGYGGNRNQLDQDLKNLARQSLISRRSIQGAQTERVQILVLTKAGKRFLAKHKLMPKDRPIYHGLVKPKEVFHDASLYRLYHKAARQIERDGGTVRKVALDYELKKQINRELARLGADRHNQDKKSEIAQAHGIRVVNGRVVVPDVQIEYENADGHLARVNLELATKHYRPGQLQAKAQAGFTLYAAGQDSDRLRRVLNDREITAEILSL
jgi:DNA-binding MarR family transcriptional regulator